jgi:hypothetical protein
MARPLEHGVLCGFRLSEEVARSFVQAAGSLGVTKSELVRALILQALQNEQLARAAIDAAGMNPPRPEYPRFASR